MLVERLEPHGQEARSAALPLLFGSFSSMQGQDVGLAHTLGKRKRRCEEPRREARPCERRSLPEAKGRLLPSSHRSLHQSRRSQLSWLVHTRARTRPELPSTRPVPSSPLSSSPPPHTRRLISSRLFRPRHAQSRRQDPPGDQQPAYLRPRTPRRPRHDLSTSPPVAPARLGR